MNDCVANSGLAAAHSPYNDPEIQQALRAIRDAEWRRRQTFELLIEMVRRVDDSTASHQMQHLAKEAKRAIEELYS